MLNRPVLLKPLINEKSMLLIKQNMYTFDVDPKANKDLIKKVIAQKFKVTPHAIRTITIKGKIKAQKKAKGYFQEKPQKKAIVEIAKGQTIPIFEKAPVPGQDVQVTTAEGEVKTQTREKKSFLRGTKVRIESIDKEKEEKKTDPKRPTKKSQKEKKKGGK